jgi:hypothetical protein
MQGWYHHPVSNQLYHNHARVWGAHQCIRDSPTLATFSTTSCPSDPPEDLWKASVQITEQAIICTGKGEIKTLSNHRSTFLETLQLSPTDRWLLVTTKNSYKI